MVLRDIHDKISKFINGLKFSSKNTDVIEEIKTILRKSDIDEYLIDKLTIQMDIKDRYSNHTERIRFLIYKNLVKIFANKKKIPKPRRHILFIGLQGSGKTTTIVKYASYLKKLKKKVIVICCDTYRAGAYDQLYQNANKACVHFWGDRLEFDPIKIMKHASYKFKKYDHILFDTSGRNIQDIRLIDEYTQMKRAVLNPQIILICDGQHGNTIKNHICGRIDMCIITKLDMRGGGGAISACSIKNIPISHIGTGEHFMNFEKYDAEVLASKITGYNEIINDDVSKQNWKRLKNNEYTLRDHYVQCLEFLKYQNIMTSMLGLPNIDVMFDKIKHHIAIMRSMTQFELETVNYIKLFKISNPRKISTRSKRVIIGSGTNYKDLYEMSSIISKFKQTFKNNKYMIEMMRKFDI